MYTYVDYTDGQHSEPGQYNARNDVNGPQNYSPYHCNQRYDYDSPGQDSPLIAIIGD